MSTYREFKFSSTDETIRRKWSRALLAVYIAVGLFAWGAQAIIVKQMDLTQHVALAADARR